MKLTHVDHNNNPGMVDVSEKSPTKRTASACSIVWMPPQIRSSLVNGEIQTKKGPVFQTAIVAGTMGVKKTAQLIPFCHPLAIGDCHFTITHTDEEIMIECFVSCFGKTGVEMEALTGAQIAALTVYDMCKALSHDMVIRDCRLVKKTGGKSDYDLKTETKR